MQVDQVNEIDVTGPQAFKLKKGTTKGEPIPEGGFMPESSRFIGVLENSKYGRHSVLVYKIPGQVNCYAFSLHRSYRFSKTYRCMGCKKEGFYTAVKVVGDYEFAENPCALDHVCLPSRWLKEKSRRTFYEQCQVWKRDGKYARETPSTELSKFLLKESATRLPVLASMLVIVAGLVLGGLLALAEQAVYAESSWWSPVAAAWVFFVACPHGISWQVRLLDSLGPATWVLFVAVRDVLRVLLSVLWSES
ncbi:unnamed protein product [Heligmosomoides polygyrus]|uniref:FLYWCH-type domain-containing protein n=1 Tax=Heligmosomoides polygyrus TaxID=6339 RepID=A0A3P8DHT0_HELPZ|nr:unnamed protein product [Heligmosomoides polygyrus]